MCPVERKVVEGWAKEAGILENEIQTAVDMEMRMRMVRPLEQRREMMVSKKKSLETDKSIKKFHKSNLYSIFS